MGSARYLRYTSYFRCFNEPHFVMNSHTNLFSTFLGIYFYSYAVYMPAVTLGAYLSYWLIVI